MFDLTAARQIVRRALARQWPGEAFGLGSLKPDPGAAAHVLCAASPDRLLVVKVYAPGASDKAQAQFARQQSVTKALPGIAPEVLFFDDALRVLGMRYIDGPTLAALWPRLAPAARLMRLEQAGRWLSRFHGLSMAAHPFRPRGPLDWLAKLVESHRSGLREIPEFPIFERHVAELESFFPLVRGRPSQRAILHRDMHLSNLLAAPGGLVGLDFENTRADEPLRDLVWLLIDAMARSDPEQYAHIPGAALARGYGALMAEPAVMIFIQRMVALGIWAATPARPSQHHVARFVAARQVAELRVPLFVPGRA
ncbi:aminoglycoside phosphotransferase family protein [Salipiger sp. 1_MG-2023]|uniref:phosphotransferase family protein n=1 Tax=Salipiger sp. 1_MG-2023 TaxID=3062665 RepID=UPI0026E206BF|nr:aminoglycoside phosphotransferase family protein [Salipiger sp. 1_MG-2023]MDO6584626.1 aminoglycoside phosphotransferase family protein [Salipiger sp. 1_MG-2023]